jgi:6-phospho-beta-glucosidase
MKIAVIGGGSTYTPELVNGFLACADRLPLRELWLMDIDPARLSVVGGFAQRMVAARGNPFRVVLSTDQRESIRGTSYVVTQLRVGQMAARVADEYLGRRHGLIGQETTGIGGMVKALRTIPVALGIARDVAETAPGAWLLNFTNPSGLITEALFRYGGDIPVVGVCNVGITTKMEILEKMQSRTGETIAPERAVLKTLGLNHLTWHSGFTVDGIDLWGDLFPGFLDELQQENEPEWDLETVKSLRRIPNGYLQYYYYPTRKLHKQEQWPPSRGEEVMSIESDLLQQYADPTLCEPPADLMKRGGAYYSTLATQLIDSHYNDLGLVEVVNVRNNGTVKSYPDDWVLEMSCKMDRNGIHPQPVEPLPLVCYGLMAHVKAYELLTVEAAVHGDRNAAYQALLAHPLGPEADQVQAVLDDMLETNKAYLPQFWQ